MKKYLLLPALAIATIAGCRKEEPASPMQYILAHPTDIYIDQYHDTLVALPVSVQKTSGYAQNVNISITSHSPYITVPHPQWNTMPDSSNPLQVICRTDSAGDYPVTISGSSPQVSRNPQPASSI